jgi:putative thioredoxin
MASSGSGPGNRPGGGSGALGGGFNTHGAVDLAALAAQRAALERAEAARAEALRAAEAGEVGTTGSPLVLDVTEASFQTDVIERSMAVPVVIDFWAEWCGPCKQLSPLLESLAVEGAGAWLLVKIDVDANPRLAQSLQVQSIPVVFVVWQGQLVPGFTGAIPEAELRAFVAQVVRLSELAPPGPADPAAEPGSQGAAAGDGETPGELFEPLDPLEEAALDALDAGDLDAAVTAFEALVAAQPTNAEARIGLARVELLRRTQGSDAVTARAAAATSPDDVAAQALVADFEIADGDVEAAITRLVDLVRRTAGDDRDAARTQLLRVFALIGDDDPRVIKGRTALANALF